MICVADESKAVAGTQSTANRSPVPDWKGTVMTRQPNDAVKTLDRGLQVLELVADHPSGLTMAEVADHLALHRTIVHRLLRTLAAHRLVASDPNKRYQLAPGVIRLAEAVNQDLRSVALPYLEELADTLRATANISVPEGNEVVVLATVEPRRADVHVAYRAGQSHPLSLGSAGLAILMARAPQPGERRLVTEARDIGYVVTHEEVIPGTWGVSAPLTARGGRIEASVGASLFRDNAIEWAGEQVRRTAQIIATGLH